MINLSFFAFIIVILYFIFTINYERINNKLKFKYRILVFLFLSIAIRLLISYYKKGYEVDINCFKSWADTAFNVGFKDFYNRISFCDYPPLYLYVLYFTGFIANFFKLSYESRVFDFLIKLPAVLFDFATIYLIYKNFIKEKEEEPFLVILMLSPAVIANSALWGQIDIIMTFLLILSFYLALSKRLELSIFVFSLAVLLKPQSLLFTPLLIVMVFYSDKVFFNLIKTKNNKLRILINSTSSLLIGIVTAFVFSYPFFGFNSLKKLLNLYFNTLSSYPYASVNALNFNYLFGGNWVPIENNFLFLNYRIYGTIFIILSVSAAILFLIKAKDKKDLYFISGVMLFSIFTFASKMHERYLFPSLILFAISYLILKDKRILNIFAITSLTYFINLMLAYNNQSEHIKNSSQVGILISFINILTLIYAYNFLIRRYFKKERKQAEGYYHKERRLVKTDLHIIILITFLYSTVAVHSLGDKKAPHTNFCFFEGDELKIELNNAEYISKLMINQGLYLGKIEFTINGVKTIKNFESVFKWHEVDIEENTDLILLKFIDLQNEKIYLNEIGIMSKDLDTILPQSVYINNRQIKEDTLFDENSPVPKYYNYKNSTYFDEIYHARTAYELIYGLTPYENTHPHLGKLIISLGIRMFGMSPFGFRIMGALFGALMLPFLYILLKRLFKNTYIASLGTLLFSFDFMHFSQTRMATIDTFIVFFIILMYLFMYEFYYSCKNDKTIKRKSLMLFLSGLSFALGISTKWTGAYAGLGLCIIYFYSLFKIKKENFKKEAIILLCLGFLFFIILPLAIYFISFIPYFKACKDPVNLDSFIRANVHMFNYHSKLVDSHPFKSSWYEWIFDIRPIWLYSGGGEKISSIASFGNPLIWIGGIFAIIFTFKKALKRNDEAILIIIGYLSQLLPWLFVKRSTFIYHYFPSTVFIIIAICFFFDIHFKENGFNNKTRFASLAYLLSALLLFLIFYPVLSGIDTNKAYLDILKIFPRYVF